MLEKRIPLRYVAKNSMFLVTNFYLNCEYYMKDASFDKDQITQHQIIDLYAKICDNLFDFDENDIDILDYTAEAYNYLPYN